MLLAYKLKHGRDFSDELAKARKVAEFAIQTRSRSSADVKHIGLKSAIASQILRKYSSDRRAGKVRNIVLTVPCQSIKYETESRIIRIPCLKLCLDASHLPLFDKINQVEVDKEYAYVSVTVLDAPMSDVEGFIGVDRNTTGYVVVAANPATGRVWKLGKECQHIHEKYKNIRRGLQKQGRYKEVKKLKNRESRVVRDINHKIAKKIVDVAVQNACGVKMEQMDGIRNNRK